MNNELTVEANAEMVEGYRDALDLSSPEPSLNRSRSYRHGFARGRDDRRGSPCGTYAALMQLAKEAMEADRND